MKLLFSEFYSPILLEEGTITTLVIENPALLRNIVLDLHGQTEGQRGSCVLSKNGTPLDIAKNMELSIDYIPFSGNRKSLITKILTETDRAGIENTEDTQNLIAAIEQYLLQLAADYPISFDANRITPAALLKLAGAQIELTEEHPLEDLLTYMDLVAELEREKVFCILNLHNFFSQEELLPFFETAILHKHRFLLLEGHAYPTLPNERQTIIDEDLCEIVL